MYKLNLLFHLSSLTLFFHFATNHLTTINFHRNKTGNDQKTPHPILRRETMANELRTVSQSDYFKLNSIRNN